jgi:hypothetical protein
MVAQTDVTTVVPTVDRLAATTDIWTAVHSVVQSAASTAVWSVAMSVWRQVGGLVRPTGGKKAAWRAVTMVVWRGFSTAVS